MARSPAPDFDDRVEAPAPGPGPASAQPTLVISRSEDFKARSPKPYNGEDPAQLSAFLLQVSLVLEARPTEFPDERSKIVYAISYLEGSALSWAYPLFRKADPPPYMTDFSLFTEKLEQTFGFPELLVAEQLQQLKQTSSVAKYSVEFRRLANHVDWNASGLVSRFYSGLKHPIKVELAKVKRPEELEDLIAMAITLDNLQQQQLAQLNPTFQPQGQPPKDFRPRSSLPANPRRRLTDQEKEHRRKNNLCMYCGGAGHFRQNCPALPKESPRSVRVSEATLVTAEPPGNELTQSL
jgi:Ty3 transposon capsid-like protein